MLAVAPTIIIRFVSDTMSPKIQCSHLETNSKQENPFKCHTTEDRIPHPPSPHTHTHTHAHAHTYTHTQAKLIKKISTNICLIPFPQILDHLRWAT